MINQGWTDEIVEVKRKKENQANLPVYERLYKDAEYYKKYREQLMLEYNKIMMPFEPNLEKNIKKKKLINSNIKTINTGARSQTPQK